MKGPPYLSCRWRKGKAGTSRNFSRFRLVAVSPTVSTHREDTLMHANTVLSRATATLAVAVITLGLSGAAQAAVDFTGKYLTTDTGGKPMQITLAPNGHAWGHRPGEYMKGSWAAGKRYAVI